jgi:glycosyltransferase involved in cell wall biosynthesis
MNQRSLRIMQVNTVDNRGGAAKSAYDLNRSYRARGHKSWLAVGYKGSDDPDVLLIPQDALRSRWAKSWLPIMNVFTPIVDEALGAKRMRNLLLWIGQPRRCLEVRRGHEDYDFPGTWRILYLSPERPEILHLHNLHGDYFDLRVLPWLSQHIPVVMTLHDIWPLSGHCSHFFDCDRWKIGCGECPDLSIYPAILSDATAYNWWRKRSIYAKCQLYVATDSHWLMDKVEQSMLVPAIVEARVIHIGVDLTIFHPGNRSEARTMLGLPQDAKLLFVSNTTPSNPWRDYATLEKAVKRAAGGLSDERIIILCLGQERGPDRIGRAEVWSFSYQKDPATVPRFYQAADIYIHAAQVDTFPISVLEAFACGTAVVATAVGGIAEQIEDGFNGFLVSPGNAEAMAARIEMLVRDEELRCQVAENAVRCARRRFDLIRYAEVYLEWYEKIVGEWYRGRSHCPL